MKIRIDEGDPLEIEECDTMGWDGGYCIKLEDGSWWHVFENSEAAGAAAKERWRDMAENDPKEFACMVGEQTLVAWALGQNAGPGSVQVASLEEWLDLMADHPEEEWNSWDGTESTFTLEAELEEIEDDSSGLPETGVCYRHG